MTDTDYIISNSVDADRNAEIYRLDTIAIKLQELITELESNAASVETVMPTFHLEILKDAENMLIKVNNALNNLKNPWQITKPG